MTQPVNPLANLTAAEATLVQALNATAGRFDAIGTTSLDEAIARVQASAAAAKDRLAHAVVSLTGIAGDIVGTYAVAAAEILAALAMNDPLPVEPEALPAPIALIVDPTSTQTDGEIPADDSPVIDLALPTVLAEEAVQQPRQDGQAVEATIEASSPSIAPQTQPQQEDAAFVAHALASLASMPEVSRMICCQHNGIGVPACDACAVRAAAFASPVASNGPVEPGRDDRQTTKRKPRGKSKRS